MVVACIALIVALSGTSYAKILALPLNSVGTPQLKANAVISSKVKDHTLLAADFKPGQLPPRGIQGYEVVSPPPNIVMNGIHNSIFMTCPAGKRAIGGGGATGGGIVPGDGPLHHIQPALRRRHRLVSGHDARGFGLFRVGRTHYLRRRSVGIDARDWPAIPCETRQSLGTTPMRPFYLPCYQTERTWVNRRHVSPLEQAARA